MYKVWRKWDRIYRKVFLFYFIYLKKRGGKHEWGEGKEGEGEQGSPLSREPDTGPNPRIPRSWTEPKADAQPTELRRCPQKRVFKAFSGD